MFGHMLASCSHDRKVSPPSSPGCPSQTWGLRLSAPFWHLLLLPAAGAVRGARCRRGGVGGGGLVAPAPCRRQRGLRGPNAGVVHAGVHGVARPVLGTALIPRVARHLLAHAQVIIWKETSAGWEKQHTHSEHQSSGADAVAWWWWWWGQGGLSRALRVRVPCAAHLPFAASERVFLAVPAPYRRRSLW